MLSVIKTKLFVLLLLLLPFLGCQSKPEVSKKQEQTKKKQLKEVFSLKGNGRVQSETFHLNGNENFVFWNYAADNPYTGNFSIYLMEKGTDIDKVGGFPIVQSTELKSSNHSALNKAAGDYYLIVNSNCNFLVKVAEMND